MLCFPNAKINLGLQVAVKREDGFHNLRSVFYPIPLYDVVEFKKSAQYNLTVWGQNKTDLSQNNLITKAWEMVRHTFNIPPQEIHLLKNIPEASGLGGGSADALFFLKEILKHHNLKITEKKLLQMAARLCSDCSFFVHNKPAYVIGRGHVVEPVQFSLKGYYCLLVLPQKQISTREAFQKIVPKAPQYNLKKLVLEKDFGRWRAELFNDFESVLPHNLLTIKEQLYKAGALYASLTGSGSAFYGIFDKKPPNLNLFNEKVIVLEL
jgi:4-diphosphocytidyl-2-C-methyl-D-erythritol kinase